MHSPDTDTDLDAAKRQLRDTMLQKRRALPQAAMLRASESVARHFADHPVLAFAPSFAGYMAMRSELDIMAVFDQMARFRKQTSLPRLSGRQQMDFRLWKPGDPLVRHTLGMLEPGETAPAVTPAVVLVPLLAFDRQGHRLGYGGGYYDRTMEAMRRFDAPPLFIGVAFGMQEVEHIPANAQDGRLDGILTEMGVSMFVRG